MPFATPATLPGRKVFSGITGHYVHLDRLTCGEVVLDAGAVVPTHQHPHEQVTYVISGRLEFTVGAETRIMEPGTCAVIPGGTPHSGRALTACRALDLFSPVREDYR
jgi:quercetin dioxygenase-like cupin family protein